MTGTTLQTAPADFIEFRRARREGATASRGPASFVWGDFVTEDDSTVEGAAGLWSPLEDSAAGLRVRASAGDQIRIGESLVDGQAVLHADAGDGPSVAYFADGAEGVIFSYDRSKYALQVWNPRSAWARRFHDIDTFEWDASWRVHAEVVPVHGGRTVAITHHRDPRPVDVPVVAEVTFSRAGQTHTLVATPGGPGEGVHVQFTDTTNGSESYGAGRGLRFVPGADGHAELDFNYATLLPCSFSLAWNCPIPPVENALPTAVRAGEKNAVDADGRALL